MSLTDRQFWIDYWEAKDNVVHVIAQQDSFSQLFETVMSAHKYNNAIEIGGFPGYHSVQLKKYFGVKQVALMDYFILPKITDDLCKINGLLPEDITQIEDDVFNPYHGMQYELVHSHGLIEHFPDTKRIVEAHFKYLQPGGKLLMTLPNFQGINGWVQKKFDIENYKKHVIESMDLKYLRNICQELNLEEIKVYYFGRFTVWLEDAQSKPKIYRSMVRFIWFCGKAFNTLIPLRNKMLSPYIVVEATKNSSAS